MNPDKLRKIRVDILNMTQQQLAGCLSVSAVTYNRWENKVVKIPYPNMLYLALVELVRKQNRVTENYLTAIKN